MKRVLPNFLLATLISLFLNFSCTSPPDTQEQAPPTLSQEANFDFVLVADSQLQGWKGVYRTIMDMEADSSETVNGKASLKIHAKEFMERSWPLITDQQQRILIPHLETDSAKILLTGKTRAMETAELVVSAMDGHEDPLYSKTLSCLSNGQWQTVSMTVPLRDVMFFHLELKATSPDTNAIWWLGKLQILVNGEDIGELSSFEGHPEAELAEADVTSLSFEQNESYAGIPELSSKKLLALGESVHGSAAINKSAMQLIKYQVANNNARLILMEMPLAQLLSYNRFIQGDEAFEIDSLLGDFYGNFSTDLLTDLLLWLKAHNQNTKDKVWFLGMDIDKTQMNTAMWLFDYLYTLNKSRPHRVYKALCAQLIKSDRSFEKMSQLVEKDSRLQVILGENEYQILRYCIEMNARISSRTRDRTPIRDSMMFENSRFLIRLLTSTPGTGTGKTVFYSHLRHSNYKTQTTDYLTRSFGSYMKEEFRNDYATLGLLVGGGSTRVWDKDSMQTKPLQAPPTHSIEFFLNRHPESYLYLPATSGPILTGPIQIRELGAYYMPDQFNSKSLSGRMDGLILSATASRLRKHERKTIRLTCIRSP